MTAKSADENANFLHGNKRLCVYELPFDCFRLLGTEYYSLCSIFVAISIA